MYADISEGTAIIINSVTGIYYGLNPFGTVIFDRILDGAAIEDIVSSVMRIPGAAEDFGKSLDAFVHATIVFWILNGKIHSVISSFIVFCLMHVSRNLP